MPQQLENYLRTYRKRAGFTQDEVAFLLGSQSGAKVSRHERGGRIPGLETVLAYELIFRTRVRDLFAGPHGRVEQHILRRAKLLSTKLLAKKQDKAAERKLASLKAIHGRILKEFADHS
jgi:transcriptional regulator with XRE-family HTH domain